MNPVQVVAEAPCVRERRGDLSEGNCDGHLTKHPECVVAALRAAGALMLEDLPHTLTELSSENCRLNALLQEALSVLGNHQDCIEPCPEASLAEKIEKVLGAS